MSRVAVSGEVLNWAVDRSRLSTEKLEKRFPRIHQWASGDSLPTLRQLESFAKATLTPLGFFFLEKAPDTSLSIPHYRTLGDESPNAPSAPLVETVQMMQRRQAWMRDFLIDQGDHPLTFVGSAKPDEDAVAVADKVRQTLGLPEGWASEQSTWTDALRVLRETMETAGILVVVNGVVGNNTHQKLDPEEFRGFALVDNYAPLVFVNGADWKAAQMFTLAHELAHVFYGKSAAFDLREMQPAKDPIEQACNRLAAEFLVPESELAQVWPAIRTKAKPFQAVARKFKTSAIVAARRTLDLGLISKQDYFDFYRKYQSAERSQAARGSDGGDFYANQNFRVGRRFASAVIQAASEGKLLYSDAYGLLGIYGRTFERYADRLKSDYS